MPYNFRAIRIRLQISRARIRALRSASPPATVHPYDIELTDIHGARRQLGEFAGKVLLIVNVASRCGFTPQYAGLEALYRRHGPRGFVVLGFPCNQFGGQEPGSENEIHQFCRATYDVGFPMFARIDVKGRGIHPLYRFLTEAAPGILGTKWIKWNFTKFLVDRQGTVLARYAPSVPPEMLDRDIEAALQDSAHAGELGRDRADRR